MREERKKKIEDVQVFRNSIFKWAQAFEEVVWLESNENNQAHSLYDAILAVDAFTAIKTDTKDAFHKLQEYQETTADWLFGYLTYDLKNDVEALSSENFDGLKFPELYFFQPKRLFLLKGNELTMLYLGMVADEMEEDFRQISKITGDHRVTSEENKSSQLDIVPRIPKEQYLEKVESLLAHIHRGDIYEANFCQEFYASPAEIEPIEVYEALNRISKSPFACYLKLQEYFMFSASPERYLQKKGNQLISQPIKGTAARSGNPEEDRKLAQQLEKDPKELSENVMIVDLVRNDLSKIAKKGSVQVEEFCKVYSFLQVHQMISTIRAEIAEGIPAVEALRTSFPMGSMTGAPKISAMKIIEELEETRRGLYSGAAGYFTPGGDFDFNVVIRSILYNKKEKYISFSVGGAITAKSIPQSEYRECMLKAKALREVLGKNIPPAN